MNNDDSKDNDFMDEFEWVLTRGLEELNETYRNHQAYLDEYFPTDIPNKVCNHACPLQKVNPRLNRPNFIG